MEGWVSEAVEMEAFVEVSFLEFFLLCLLYRENSVLRIWEGKGCGNGWNLDKWCMGHFLKFLHKQSIVGFRMINSVYLNFCI